jgi:hypothetical protein
MDVGARAQTSAQTCNLEFGRAALYNSPSAPRWVGGGRLCSQLITEQADISLTRGAEVKGHCGHNESELQVFWVDRAYALKMLFVKVTVSQAHKGAIDWRWVWAVGVPGFPNRVATGAVDTGGVSLLAGKPQHFHGTRGDLEAEQGAVCLWLFWEDPL